VGDPAGVTDADGDEVADGDSEEVVGLGDADGEGLVLGVEVALADGDAEAERDGVALWVGAEVVPCAGPTRLGLCTGW
jgi:hypothetical protein